MSHCPTVSVPVSVPPVVPPLAPSCPPLTSYPPRTHPPQVTDERIGVMNEILNAIKLIKLYAWEDSFADKVHRIRTRETVLLGKAAFLRVLNLVLTQSAPVFVTVATFLCHALISETPLRAADAFATIRRQCAKVRDAHG